MENIDMDARCETSEDYLAAKGQTEEFEPYKTYPLSAELIARQLNAPVRMFPWLGMGHPIDGDALNREAAAELGATLRSIVEGPKLTGNAWVQVLP